MTQTLPTTIGATTTPTWSFSKLQGTPLPKNCTTTNYDLSLAKGEKRTVKLDFSEILTDAPSLFSALTGTLAPQSELTLEIFSNAPAKTTLAIRNQLRLNSDARLQVSEFYTGSGCNLISHQLDIRGSNAYIKYNTGFALTKAPGELHLHYHLTHQAINAQSYLNCTGVLTSHTHKTWHPILEYLPESHACLGRENEKVLLLGKNLENHSAPLILTSVDDLDAAHAVTSGGVSDDILAYLASRGMTVAQVHTFYVRSQLHAATKHFTDKSLQTKLKKIIDQIEEKQ